MLAWFPVCKIILQCFKSHLFATRSFVSLFAENFKFCQMKIFAENEQNFLKRKECKFLYLILLKKKSCNCKFLVFFPFWRLVWTNKEMNWRFFSFQMKCKKRFISSTDHSCFLTRSSEQSVCLDDNRFSNLKSCPAIIAVIESKPSFCDWTKAIEPSRNEIESERRARKILFRWFDVFTF